jgi:hypothetical protein
VLLAPWRTWNGKSVSIWLDESMAETDEARYEVISRQAGDWSVRQRVWSSPTAEPIELPPMVARRRMVRDVFLEEVMEAAPSSGQAPFTRTAYLSFNPINRRFEHVTLDSRYPPVMFETSVDDKLEDSRTIVLYVTGFTTPSGFGEIPPREWASQRRLLTVQDPDTTVCRQYWTLPQRAPFLAMEYAYERI